MEEGLGTRTRSAATLGRVVASRKAAAIVHYASLLVAAILLAYIGRDQWFDFDEWAWIWEPRAELWAGHVGHWSTVPIAVWTGIQDVLGLGSYLPFLAIELATHLLVAHLLWRLLLRVGSQPWIATGLVGVFLVLGAGAENIFWAFQFAFIGAIACGLGALLLSLRPRLTAGTGLAIAGLLLLGVMTAGTVLPLMVPVAIVVWRSFGWRRAAQIVAVPAAAYVIWVLFVAGPGPQDGMRATGVDVLLVPQFAGAMLVDGLTSVVPMSQIGAPLIGALALGVLWLLRRRLTTAELVCVSMVGGGLIFALLSGYSRWNLGLDSADSSRYVYFLYVMLAPLMAVLLTRLARGSWRSLALILGGIVVVGVFNVGTLITSAREQAAEENYTHEVISAALSLHDSHPEGVELTASPDVTVLPQTDLAALVALRDDGLDTVPSSPAARLTAVLNVGLEVSEAPRPGVCSTVVQGTILPSGSVVSTTGGANVTLIAIENGLQGKPRTLALGPGSHTLTTADGTAVQIAGIDVADACSDAETRR